jgi:uncharacterized protein (UPF0276 family)
MNASSKPGEAASIKPSLGSGMGYRRELKDGILESRGAIDFLEVITEQFTGSPAQLRELEQLCDVFPVIPHGVGLSIGSETLDEDYIRQIKRVSDLTESPYYSEHLAMTRSAGIDIGHLSPLWFTEAMLRLTTGHVLRVQDMLNKPLVLENVTYPFDIPNSGMTQTEFFCRLVEATGCGILLDVTNVHINSVNHHFDPAAFLRQMPLDHLTQIHLAGGYVSNGMMIDGHSEMVDEGTWRLLETLTSLTPVRASILEHDANFPDRISVLLGQLARAREIMSRQVSAVA